MATDSLQGITVFVRVAEARSFTVAARKLGISTSGASKAVARLEDKLGVRLVHRTTRSVGLTDDGTAYYERCRQILGELEEAESAVTRARAQPRGRLRVLLPVAFGQRILAPLMAQFAELNPELVIDIELSDRVPDLADEGLDAAVRIGELGDSRLIARRLCDLRFITVASPEYLERRGEPKTPDELDNHRCLSIYIPHTHRYRAWEFSAKGSRFNKIPAGALNINNAHALLHAAIAGAGIANIPTFTAFDSVRAGLLQPILREYECAGPPVWIVYLERRHLSPRVQAFVDFLTTHIPPLPAWDAFLK
jgi:LysR family transcriptional regulator, regulator for bpeEF and oprC